MKQNHYDDIILGMSKNEENTEDVGGEAPETDDEEADA